jgi:hypothetical protein
MQVDNSDPEIKADTLQELVNHAVADVEKGKKAVEESEEHYKEGQKAVEAAEEHFKAAGKRIAQCKKRFKRETNLTWAQFCKEKFDLTAQRANQLIALSDGRTTLQKMRQDNKDAVRRHRLKKSKLRNFNPPPMPEEVGEDPKNGATPEQTQRNAKTAATTNKGTAEPPLTADEQSAIQTLTESIAGLVPLSKQYVTQDSVAGFLVDAVSAEDIRAVARLIYEIEAQVDERERAADKAKRIAREAKNPTKAYEKARARAINEAMEDDMREARAEGELGGPGGETKEDWTREWITYHWDGAAQAEFDADFREKWKDDHGTEFPEPPTEPELAEAS